MKKLFNGKKKFLFYFILGLALLTVISVIALNFSEFSASREKPEIVFKDTVYDFGKVPQGPPLYYNFIFTNKGSGILKIENIRTRCGCIAATAGEKKDYKKNESGEIKVEFITVGRQGHQEKGIVVVTNDTINSEISLRVKCDIDSSLNY